MTQTQEQVNAELRASIELNKQMISQGKWKWAPTYAAEKYTPQEVLDAKNRDRLLFANMEFFNGCNLACPGCFNDFDQVDACQLSQQATITEKVSPNKRQKHEHFETIDQLTEAGVKTINLIGGGEPLLYEGFFELAAYVRAKGLNVWTFTNGIQITPEVARQLYDHEVTTVVKLNSLNPTEHDTMVGKPGKHGLAMRGLNNMLAAGYTKDEKHQLGVESIVTHDNYTSIPDLWRFARNNNMLPYIERTVGCNLKLAKGKIVTPDDLGNLWRNLLKIDQTEYGFTWPLLPLMAADHCASNDHSVYISISGDVRPCGGTPVTLGNIGRSHIKDIIKGSNLLKQIRELRDQSTGYCSECEYAKEYNCSGCRGYSFAVTKNVLADDPACFHNPANLVRTN